MRAGIEITSRCNLACPFCGYATMERAKIDMPRSLWQPIFEDIRDNGHELRSMALYGEPLLSEQYIPALRYLAENVMYVTNAFYTNATLLTPKKTDELIESGFFNVHRRTRKVWLGLDTFDHEVYRRLRGGNWIETAENIEYFLDAGGRDLPGVAVQLMRTCLNEDESPEPMQDYFNCDIAVREVGRQFNKANDMTVKAFEGDCRPDCRELWGTIWISSDGRATACCIDGEFEMSFGGFPGQSLQDLAGCATLKDQRENFGKQNYDELTLCQRCHGDEPRGRR